jgi:hypothetical protein
MRKIAPVEELTRAIRAVADDRPRTVDEYRARLKDRLGPERRPELVRFALRTGILAEP